ncbi:jg27482, partial [Pararge aegeria aegeria]
FTTDYQFNIVRAVFTFTPEYNLIDAPYQIQNPKRLFAPLKLKPRKEPKKEKPSKGKKKEIETEEYLALMELRARDEKDQNEREDRDQDAWHRRNHILPLNFATDDEFFNKFWPPPPPETEPVPEPDPKGKGKGRRKK